MYQNQDVKPPPYAAGPPPPPPSTTTVFITNPRSPLEYDTRFRTCCCHVTLFGKIIAGIEIGLILFGLLGLVAPLTTAHLVITIFNCLINIVCVGLLIAGLVKERRGFLIPYMVLKVFVAVGNVIVAIILFVFGATASWTTSTQSRPSSHSDNDNDFVRQVYASAFLCFILAIVFLAFAGLMIWFFVTILRCYQYYQEKSMIGRTNNIPINANAANTVNTYPVHAGFGGYGGYPIQQPQSDPK